jgi:hypothetical protein
VGHTGGSTDRTTANARTKISGVSVQFGAKGAESRIGGIWRNSVFRSGAPRSMKMGNIRSPWRYDAARQTTP